MYKLYGILFLSWINYINCQTFNNVGLGLPDAWDGDKYGVLDCPATNIPTFLDGYFLCQFSASYGNASNPDAQKLVHMIDAIGAVGSFRISNGTVSFSAQYYPSINYKIWDFYERDMAKSTVAWSVSFGYINYTSEKLWNNIPPDTNIAPASPDVDFWKIGKDIVGGTEGNFLGYTFDVPTLSDFKLYPFVEQSDGTLPDVDVLEVGIHTHRDKDGTNWAGFIAMGMVGNDYHFYQGLYTVDPQGNRKIVGLYDYGKFDFSQCGPNGEFNGDPNILPGYVHSITATYNYIIIPVTSLVFNPCLTIVQPNGTIGMGSFAHTQWFDTVPFRFLVFRKTSKTWMTTAPIDYSAALFVAHQLNAYEINEYNIVADMITYTNNDPYEKYLTRPFITTQLYPESGSVTRFNLLLQQNKVTSSVLTPQPKLAIEFPQMNNAYRSNFYTWSYIVHNPYAAGNSILKINVNDKSGKQNSEYRGGTTIGLCEPVFVAKPNSTSEDDGVLIIRGLDTSTGKGVLVVVDAQKMMEIGRANVPISVPFGFHNKFFAIDSL